MKILVELLHGIGDTVCALPMLQILREQYPDAYIVVLTKSEAGNEVINSSGITINETRSFNIYKNLRQSLFFMHQLRNEHFDYGISSVVTPVRKAKYFFKIVNPKRWIGWQKEGKTFDLMNDRYHFVEANILAIREICKIPSTKIYPHLNADKGIAKKLELKLQNIKKRKIVGICIGNADYSLKNKYLRIGKVYTRSWGIENMTELIRNLHNHGLAIVLIGGRNEQLLLSYIENHLGKLDDIYNFVGKTSLKESIALASLCDVVFGVDTGMQHVATAVGTKTVSVFGPTNPATHGAYSPLASFLVNRNVCDKQFCYGTRYYVDCPNERICLKSVSVHKVYAKIIQSLYG